MLRGQSHGNSNNNYIDFNLYNWNVMDGVVNSAPSLRVIDIRKSALAVAIGDDCS